MRKLGKLKHMRDGVLDKAGMAASTACAIHCAVMPLILTIAPLGLFGVMASEPIEWGMLLVSATLSTVSLCFGHKVHRSKKALAIMALAMTALLTGRISHHTYGAISVSLLVVGGLGLATAHWVNMRLCKSCPRCNH